MLCLGNNGRGISGGGNLNALVLQMRRGDPNCVLGVQYNDYCIVNFSKMIFVGSCVLRVSKTIFSVKCGLFMAHNNQRTLCNILELT